MFCVDTTDLMFSVLFPFLNWEATIEMMDEPLLP